MIVADRVVPVQCMEQVPGSASTVRRLELTIAGIVYDLHSSRGLSDVGSWLPKIFVIFRDYHPTLDNHLNVLAFVVLK